MGELRLLAGSSPTTGMQINSDTYPYIFGLNTITISDLSPLHYCTATLVAMGELRLLAGSSPATGMRTNSNPSPSLPCDR
jgi:hypothetical protein